MIFIELENDEAKSLADFVEMEFPLFIKEGEVENMNYIFEVSSAFKKIKDKLNESDVNNGKTIDHIADVGKKE